MFSINPHDLPGRLADLVRVPIDYVLEVHVNGKLHKGLSTSLPNTPSNTRIVWAFPTSTEPTLGEVPIREHSSPRYGTLSFSGKSGRQARSGYDRKGNVIFKGGPEVLREFNEFIRAYQTKAADRSRSKTVGREIDEGVVLVFRDLREDIHVKVEIEDWQYSQDIGSTRHSYDWSITFRAWGSATRKVPTSILAPLDSWAAKAQEAIADVNAVGALASNALINARGDLDALRGPLQELQRTGQIAAQIARGAGGIARFPKDVLSDMAAIAESFAAAWRETVTVGDDFRRDYIDGGATKDFTDRLRRIGWLTETASQNATAVAGAYGVGPNHRRSWSIGQLDVGSILPRFSWRVPPRRGPSTTTATVYALRPGDTLRSIAANVYGSATRWVDIAYYNGFPDAYTDAVGFPLRPGVSVLLPGVGETDGGVFESIEAADDLFGCDLYLDPTTGDLVFEDDDVRTVRGVLNFQLALARRLTTSQGEARLYPGYGLPVAPGDATSPRMAGYVAAHVRDQLLSDVRVSDVTDLSVVDGGDRLDIRVQVQPTAGSSFSVIAPVRVGR